jgi:hypothetical protein
MTPEDRVGVLRAYPTRLSKTVWPRLLQFVQAATGLSGTTFQVLPASHAKMKADHSSRALRRSFK